MVGMPAHRVHSSVVTLLSVTWTGVRRGARVECGAYSTARYSTVQYGGLRAYKGWARQQEQGQLRNTDDDDDHEEVGSGAVPCGAVRVTSGAYIDPRAYDQLM